MARRRTGLAAGVRDFGLAGGAIRRAEALVAPDSGLASPSAAGARAADWAANSAACAASSLAAQHFLYLLPELHGHGSLRPIFITGGSPAAREPAANHWVKPRKRGHGSCVP